MHFYGNYERESSCKVDTSVREQQRPCPTQPEPMPAPPQHKLGVSASGETDQNSSQLRPQLGMEVRPQTEVRLSLIVRLCPLSVFLK